MAQVRPQGSVADERVMTLFLKAVDALGGMRRLVEQRRLAILPELLESAYVLVLQEDEHQSPEQIAERLGVSTETVANILSAPSDEAVRRAEHALPADVAGRETIAGGVARHAYNSMREQPGAL